MRIREHWRGRPSPTSALVEACLVGERITAASCNMALGAAAESSVVAEIPSGRSVVLDAHVRPAGGDAGGQGHGCGHAMRADGHGLSPRSATRCGAIDGLSASSAQVILTEVGADLHAFPTEKHFVSWLRFCPRRPISGGKPVKGWRNGTGASRVAAALRMAAVAVQRSKTALGAAYRRIARHRGAAIAVFAVARKIAQHVYRALRHGQPYLDIGESSTKLATSSAAYWPFTRPQVSSGTRAFRRPRSGRFQVRTRRAAKAHRAPAPRALARPSPIPASRRRTAPPSQPRAHRTPRDPRS